MLRRPIGLAPAEYAKQRGVSRTSVYLAIRAGQISTLADGSIDPEVADREWVETKRKPLGAPKLEKAEAEAALKSVKELLDQGLPEKAGITMAQAQLAHELAKVRLAEIKLRERRGELIDRSRAEAQVFRLARQQRDAWQTWPARVAALVAAELGVDPHLMQAALDGSVRRHLAELSEVKPELG